MIRINPGSARLFLQSRSQMNGEPTTPARILLVDAQEIVRLGVRHLLGNFTDLAICGEVDSMQDALHAVSTSRPDVVVLDLSIGDGDGLDLIRRLRTLDPTLPVVVYSAYDESAFAEVAFLAGARGYVTKLESPSTLIRAIREALATAGESSA